MKKYNAITHPEDRDRLLKAFAERAKARSQNIISYIMSLNKLMEKY